MQDTPVITIDGPGGSGKGTVSRIVARRLRWHFLDSGALYRLVGLSAARNGVGLTDEAALARIAEQLDVYFDANGDENSPIILEGEDVSRILRSESSAEAASMVAVLPGVRQALLQRQRDFRRPPGLVADGRDMGAVVFPDAELKIYLEASQQERAARRYKQLMDKGMDVSLEALLREIRVRDERDGARQASPMRPAKDAELIDTTRMDIDEVVETVLQLWQDRKK
jgi:CMP/dCMP kinase